MPENAEVAVEIKYKQESITPFWQKLPFFFLFPFRLGPLIFMVCIIAASAVAGLGLGRFGLAFKGFLVYLGLRYAFNVLELFSQGRFEGQSVDHTLWGPEKRPAKLGFLILLYLVIGIMLGNALVTSRIATNPAVQTQLIDLYKKDHAAEIAERERERAAFNARIGLSSPPAANASSNETPGGDPDSDNSTDNEQSASSGPDQTAPPVAATRQQAATVDDGMSREEIFMLYKPSPSDPLWFKLQPAWYWIVMLVLSLMLPSGAIVIALEDRFFKVRPMSCF